MTTDPKTDAGPLDLVLTRVIDAPRALVWKAWTDPEHLKKWWAPKPYTTASCTLDVRPGGEFRAVMCDPDGNELPTTTGVFLEVVERERLTFTDALLPGYRPAPSAFMTAIITFEDHRSGGTAYTARVLHKDEADRKRHEEMGFHEGWGTCADQLAALARRLGETR